MPSRRHSYFLALVSFLILTTIGFAQVNSATLALFPVMRQAAIVVCGFAIIGVLLHNKINIGFLIAVFALATLYLVSLLQSGQFFFEEFGLQRLTFSFLVALVGIFLLALTSSYQKSRSVSIFFQLYAAAVLAYIYFTGGISLLPAPRFNYDLTSESGSILLYNQGTTKFFGLAAICALWSFFDSKAGVAQLLSFSLFCFFAFWSFLGGGRGDFAMLIAVGLLMMSLSGSRSIAYIIAFGVFAFVSLEASIYNVLSDSTAFMRIQVILQGDSFGMRDILFFEAYRLLMNEPRCLLVGCGFAFFQEYHSYPYGLYPHNILLEAVITWGLVFILPITIFFFVGLWKSRNSLGILFWVGIFFVGVGMKSGDVINSWFAMSFVMYVSAVGCKKLFFRRGAERRITA